MKKSMSATRISTLDHGDSGQAGRFGPAAPSIILMHLRQRVSLAARDRKCSISDSEACVVYTCFDSAARVCVNDYISANYPQYVVPNVWNDHKFPPRTEKPGPGRITHSG